jgi:hypothetical protein
MQEGRDALLRSAISRAYYAAVMSCREFLTRRFGFKAPVFSTHVAIKQELELRIKVLPRLYVVWKRIDAMQKLRTEADYLNEFRSLPLAEAAEQAVGDAMDIRSALRALK